MPESELLAMLRRAEDELRRLKYELQVMEQRLGRAEQIAAVVASPGAN